MSSLKLGRPAAGILMTEHRHDPALPLTPPRG